MTANTATQKRFRKLWWWNVAACAAHTGSCVAQIALAANSNPGIPTFVRELNGPPSSALYVETALSVPAYPRVFSILFSAVSALFHIVIVLDFPWLKYFGVGWTTYVRNIQQKRNPIRWAEYVVSSTLCLVENGVLSGLTDLAQILGLVSGNVAMILFGHLAERLWLAERNLRIERRFVELIHADYVAASKLSNNSRLTSGSLQETAQDLRLGDDDDDHATFIDWLNESAPSLPKAYVRKDTRLTGRTAMEFQPLRTSNVEREVEHHEFAWREGWVQSFVFGSLVGVLPWVSLFVYFGSAAARANVSALIYLIIVGLFVQFFLFAVVMLVQHMKRTVIVSLGCFEVAVAVAVSRRREQSDGVLVPRSRVSFTTWYEFGEFLYVLLSLQTKTWLSWFAFFAPM